jgi:hypothetical protein
MRLGSIVLVVSRGNAQSLREACASSQNPRAILKGNAATR